MHENRTCRREKFPWTPMCRCSDAKAVLPLGSGTREQIRWLQVTRLEWLPRDQWSCQPLCRLQRLQRALSSVCEPVINSKRRHLEGMKRAHYRTLCYDYGSACEELQKGGAISIGSYLCVCLHHRICRHCCFVTASCSDDWSNWILWRRRAFFVDFHHKLQT